MASVCGLSEALAVKRVVFLHRLGIAALGLQFHVFQHHVLVLRMLFQVRAVAGCGGVLLAAARTGAGSAEQGTGILGRDGENALEAVLRQGVVADPGGHLAAERANTSHSPVRVRRRD
jgi:hypothetical protein